MSQGEIDPAADPKAAPTAEAVTPGRHVVFSHGKESGPWGRKISSLAEVARSEGYESHSVDYRGIDDPRQRVARLVEFSKELSGDLVLVGSSLGGYVRDDRGPQWQVKRHPIEHRAGRDQREQREQPGHCDQHCDETQRGPYQAGNEVRQRWKGRLR